MSTEENKAIVRRHLIDVLEQGHVELIPSYYAPDGSKPANDTPEQWRDRVLEHHKIGPGFKITILDMVAEGDKVVVRWTLRATQATEYQGHPPNGKSMTVTGISIFRLAGGKIQEITVNMDRLGQMDQLGWLPAAPSSK